MYKVNFSQHDMIISRELTVKSAPNHGISHATDAFGLSGEPGGASHYIVVLEVNCDRINPRKAHP
jgi:hypothetical protein